MKLKGSLQILLVTATALFCSVPAWAQDPAAAPAGSPDSSVEVYDLDGSPATTHAQVAPAAAAQPTTDSSVEVYNLDGTPSAPHDDKAAAQAPVSPIAPPPPAVAAAPIDTTAVNETPPAASLPKADAQATEAAENQAAAPAAQKNPVMPDSVKPAQASSESLLDAGQKTPASEAAEKQPSAVEDITQEQSALPPPAAPAQKNPIAPDSAKAVEMPAADSGKNPNQTAALLAAPATAPKTMPLLNDYTPPAPLPVAAAKASPAEAKKAIEQEVPPPAAKDLAKVDSRKLLEKAPDAAPGAMEKEKEAQAAREEADDQKSEQCPDAHEMQRSLIKKIGLLENEKEGLRARLEKMEPGKIEPVYQCAAETNKIADLEAQVKYLTEEYETLKKQNQELSAPKSDDKAPKTKGAPPPPHGLNPNDPNALNDNAEKAHERVSAESSESPAADQKTGRDRAEVLDVDPANEHVRGIGK